jgi:catalase
VPEDSGASERYRLSALTNKSALAKLAAIGVVVLVVAGCFAYVAGWLSPHRLTQARFIDRFQDVNGGIHAGFRRNHAKGVCVAGSFDSNGNGQRLSKAVVFRPGSVPVAGRFSVPGGHPHQADGPMEVHALGLSFRPPDGQEWRTAMIDLPVFIVKNGEGLYEQLLASQPDPTTGKPDPAKMAAFIAAHPEFARAMQLIKASPLASGFANASYNSLHAFRFVNEGGTVTPVRWSMVATEPFAPAKPEQAKNPDKNYLFDDMIARVTRGPLQWHLVITIGQPGDSTNDSTIPWPSNRERVDVGTLTIDHVESEAPGNCRDINFDPLVLPFGIEPSDDPIPSARSATYSESFRRRAGERKTPSAVQVPVTDKGS